METPTPDPQPEAAPPDADAGRGRRRRIAIISVSAAAVVAVVALLVVGLLNQDVPTTIQDALAKGERPAAPALDLPLLTTADGLGEPGDRVSVADLEGRIVVLNFWASWCEPCEAEAPILEGIARGYRERGENVVVLGVDVQDAASSATAFMERHGMTYATLRDGGSSTERRWETTGVPETFIIDPEGHVALKKTGQLVHPDELTVAIEQLLAEERAERPAEEPAG